MWVMLNDEGKKVWGDVFPDGKVPVTSMSFHEAKLGPGSRTEAVVLVSWQALSKTEKDGVLTKIVEKSGAPREAIFADILRIGMPLRKSLTTGVIAAELRFFI